MIGKTSRNPASLFLTICCNSDVIDMLYTGSIGAHRLLMVALSSAYPPRTAVELSIDKFFSITGASSESGWSKVKRPFLEIKKMWQFFDSMHTHGYADERLIVFEFSRYWIESMPKQLIMIPKSFFAVCHRHNASAYRLGIRLYYEAALRKTKCLCLTIAKAYEFCGGVFPDHAITDWKKFTLERTERALEFLRKNGMINDWGYKIENHKIHMPPRTNAEEEVAMYSEYYKTHYSYRDRFCSCKDMIIHVCLLFPKNFEAMENNGSFSKEEEYL